MHINKLKPSGKQPFTLHHFAILLGQFSSGNFKLRCEIYQPYPADDISNICAKYSASAKSLGMQGLESWVTE